MSTAYAPTTVKRLWLQVRLPGGNFAHIASRYGSTRESALLAYQRARREGYYFGHLGPNDRRPLPVDKTTGKASYRLSERGADGGWVTVKEWSA